MKRPLFIDVWVSPLNKILSQMNFNELPTYIKAKTPPLLNMTSSIMLISIGQPIFSLSSISRILRVSSDHLLLAKTQKSTYRPPEWTKPPNTMNPSHFPGLPYITMPKCIPFWPKYTQTRIISRLLLIRHMNPVVPN